MKTIATILFVLCLNQTMAQGSVKDLAIVQNKTGFERGKLTEVRQIFLGKYFRWPNSGEQSTIVLPSSKSSSAAVVAFVLYKGTVRDMQKYWLSLVFQGRANPPVFFDTDAEIIQYVLKTPGAIGVVGTTSRSGIDEKYKFLFVE